MDKINKKKLCSKHCIDIAPKRPQCPKCKSENIKIITAIHIDIKDKRTGHIYKCMYCNKEFEFVFK